MGHRRSATAKLPPALAHSKNGMPLALVAGATVMVELTDAPAGVTLTGENEQLSPDGSPEQLKLTA